MSTQIPDLRRKGGSLVSKSNATTTPTKSHVSNKASGGSGGSPKGKSTMEKSHIPMGTTHHLPGTMPSYLK